MITQNVERDYRTNRDFWHWLISRYEVHNGCFVIFSEEVLEGIKIDWVKTIYSHYIDEFSENGELKLFVWW